MLKYVLCNKITQKQIKNYSPEHQSCDVCLHVGGLASCVHSQTKKCLYLFKILKIIQFKNNYNYKDDVHSNLFMNTFGGAAARMFNTV